MASGNVSIPLTQRAAVIKTKGQYEVVSDWPVTQPSELQPGQCLIHMELSGVCHSDLHILRGEWYTRPLPLVGGHEGVGKVIALGPGTPESNHVRIGSRVGIRWTAYACGKCEQCRSGNETVCPEKLNSGQTVHGTFCEYAVGYVNVVVPIPEGVPSDMAAPALCAGLTVYRGLKGSNTKAGDWVAIPGAGGGLGHMGIQYAVAMGLRVLAIDTGDDKKEISLQNGAEKWIDFKQSTNIIEDVTLACDGKGPHAAVVTSPVGAVYDQALMYMRISGTLVVLAMPKEALKSPLILLVAKNLKINASAVGSLQDAIEAMDFVKRGKVKPHIQHRKLEDINDIFREMEEGALVGRAIIRF